jgi:hypothetical protein
VTLCLDGVQVRGRLSAITTVGSNKPVDIGGDGVALSGF